MNLDTLEELRHRHRGHPRHPPGPGPRRQARPGQGARPGRAHQGAHRPAPTVSRARQCGRSKPQAAPPTSSRFPGGPAPAGPRERTHQPVATLAPPRRQEVVGPMSGLSRLREHVPGPRPSEQDLLHDLHHRDLSRRVVRSRAVRGLQRDPRAEEAAATGAIGFLDLFSGGALTGAAVFALGIMPYITSSIIMQLLGVVIPKLESGRTRARPGRRRSRSGPATSRWRSR